MVSTSYLWSEHLGHKVVALIMLCHHQHLQKMIFYSVLLSLTLKYANFSFHLKPRETRESTAKLYLHRIRIKYEIPIFCKNLFLSPGIFLLPFAGIFNYLSEKMKHFVPLILVISFIHSCLLLAIGNDENQII